MTAIAPQTPRYPIPNIPARLASAVPLASLALSFV